MPADFEKTKNKKSPFGLRMRWAGRRDEWGGGDLAALSGAETRGEQIRKLTCFHKQEAWALLGPSTVCLPASISSSSAPQRCFRNAVLPCDPGRGLLLAHTRPSPDFEAGALTLDPDSLPSLTPPRPDLLCFPQMQRHFPPRDSPRFSLCQECCDHNPCVL